MSSPAVLTALYSTVLEYIQSQKLISFPFLSFLGQQRPRTMEARHLQRHFRRSGRVRRHDWIAGLQGPRRPAICSGYSDLHWVDGAEYRAGCGDVYSASFAE